MVMREVRDAIAEILDHTTLAMVCRKVDQARESQRAPEAYVYEI
jgi:DNA-binding IscR family transcriptional regulator